jgi:putative two-component system response regulator
MPLPAAAAARSATEIPSRDSATRPGVGLEPPAPNELEERATAFALAEIFGFRDQATALHQNRIASYVELLAAALGLAPRQQRLFADAAKLHDIGKLGIAQHLLDKSSPLDAEELRQLRQHPVIGARLLAGFRTPEMVLARVVALCHHEHWDGSGYPWGLRGEEIPLPARLVTLGDRYDALRSERPYKRGFDHETTRRILLQGDGRSLPSHFDPHLLTLFAEHHEGFEQVFEAHMGGLADGA